MKKRENTYIIGLTGNIASGKSVVRKILERLGGYGIDADRLAHRALEKNTPTYHQVVKRFGKNILDENGNINRKALAKVVFADDEALQQLESIIHPFVLQAIELLIERVSRPIVIIEAIKLIESGLTAYCDSLWVVDASYETRQARLMTERGLSAAEAELRLNAQPPQAEKIARADVVIPNEGSIAQVCQAVTEAWTQIEARYRTSPLSKKCVPLGNEGWAEVEQVHVDHAVEFGNWLLKQSQAVSLDLSHSFIQDLLCIKPFLCLRFNDKILVGIGWQRENFILCIDDVWIDSSSSLPLSHLALQVLAQQIEEEAKQTACEGMIWFLPSSLKNTGWIWQTMGYTIRDPQAFPAASWLETVGSFHKDDQLLFAKSLLQQ